MHLLLISIRNLARNKRRTMVTSLTVGLGAMAIVLLQGFVNGFVQGIIDSSVLAKAGAVQVFKSGYLGSDDPLRNTLPDDASLVERIANIPGVVAVAPRIDFDGMLSNGSEATMFAATAIDPSREYKVCPRRATHIAAGSQPLTSGERTHVLIGKALAESLNANQGASLVMQAAGAHAGTNALDVKVTGFLPSFHPAESKRVVTVDFHFAQDLLRMKGRLTQYAVGIEDINEADAVAGRISAAIGNGYQVTTWKQMDPLMYDRARLFRAILLFVACILFLLVITGIVNTMMMAVYERVREIGTMLAVGIRRWQIAVLFLWEATLLGLFSSATGSFAAWALVKIIGHKGLQVSMPGIDSFILNPTVGVSFLFAVLAFVLAGTSAAALYPAWKASHLHPVEALRAN